MSKVSAIVLAAGSGSRMQSETKKQFMTLMGKPLIWHSLNAFEKSDVDEVILVVPEDDLIFAEENIVDKYNFTKVSQIVAGGNERFESVYEGLKSVTGDIVLIHDGARALVDEKTIKRCIEGAWKFNACVAGMPAKDTIKKVDSDLRVIGTPNRDSLYITQTPQAFNTKVVKDAYERLIEGGDDSVTDDAMVVEKYSDIAVVFVEGSYSNIKITTPEDMIIAEALIKGKNTQN